MAISLVKEFKQKQKISLTPLLKKSIDLLQLSRFELIQKIEKEIEVNPFIEKEIVEGETFDSNNINSDDFDFNVAASENLRESLIGQINELSLDERERKIALFLTGCLDEAGQLVEQIQDIEKMFGFEASYDDIEKILIEIIQRLEPSGVGYRNFKECIKIQITKKRIKEEIKDLCNKILFENSSDDLEIIKNKLIKESYSKQDIDNAVDEIKSCDLSPGLNYERTNYIIPDLKIKLKDKDILVNFVTENFPKLKIDNDLITQISNELKKNPNKELSEKIQDAKWLISSVKKRNDTVKRVGELVCKKQISFLGNNPLKINPLSNKDVAGELNVHPSTVSRILRSKYIDTPKGIIPLKSLLVTSVSKTRSVTPLQLMELIEGIIKIETKPKSDNKIALELNKRGFSLARRTITKYRKKLNISSTRIR
ncbi:MAG: RNA polymerase sigma-54 factor [Gammaproteobacteria bacterium]|jgi:RNA polymerase sigma-54 factor|tara:strand:- start:4055 stop:5332 length:1278 start_codon:yes stop_codon:yes gene_type:complete